MWFSDVNLRPYTEDTMYVVGGGMYDVSADIGGRLLTVDEADGSDPDLNGTQPYGHACGYRYAGRIRGLTTVRRCRLTSA